MGRRRSAGAGAGGGGGGGGAGGGGRLELRLVPIIEQFRDQLKRSKTVVRATSSSAGASGSKAAPATVSYDPDEVVEVLRSRYKEFERHKKNPLRQVVERALNVIRMRDVQRARSHRDGSDEADSDDDEDDDDEDEDDDQEGDDDDEDKDEEEEEDDDRAARMESRRRGTKDREADGPVAAPDHSTASASAAAGTADDGDDSDDTAGGRSRSMQVDLAAGTPAPVRMMTVKRARLQDPNILNLALARAYQAQTAKPDAAAPAPAPAPAAPVAAPVAAPAPKRRRIEPPTPGAAAPPPPSTKRAPRAAASADGAPPVRSSLASRPTLRFADLGGIESCLQDVRELIEYPLTHPEIYVHLGVEPPRGILLHGPPGCGKTMLANAIAGDLGLPFLKISAPEIVSGMSGESEQRVRDLFSEAKELAPCLVFIDEIDAVTPKRETAQREMERRIVAQLLTCMDDVSMENTGNRPVCIIGATNRPDALDPALRRAGRFDREIAMGIPDEAARARILQVLVKKLRLSGDFNFRALARATPGFVGADLQALAKEAAVLAVNRIFRELHALAPAGGAPAPAVAAADKTRTDASDYLRSLTEPLTDEQLEPLCITMADFEHAITIVQPSSKREGFASIPDVTWSDVGALESVREELFMTIVRPIREPDLFASMGISTPAGVLLYGPPGCGKTLLAKAIANESRANFISVKGPELLNKFVGESERAVRQVFQRARASAPCIVFFDELDALCPRRSDDSQSQTSERVVNQLLTEMDGLDGRKHVFVIAATNRPDIIDPAMLRPGRLDKLLYVPLPSPDERVAIVRTVAAKTPLRADVDLAELVRGGRCNGFSGADLAALVREAAVAAVRDGSRDVSRNHLDSALAKVFPSVSAADARSYNNLQRSLRTRRSHLPPAVPEPAAEPGTPAAAVP